MQNELQHNDEGVSILELLRVAWLKKWFIIILTLSFTLILTLLVLFLNPILERLSISFDYNFISESSNTLPNGDFFRPASLISEEFLVAVRDSNSKYAAIDIEEILEDAENISLLFIENDSGDNYYTIEVKTKLFGGRTLATDFIHDLISYFYDRILLGEEYNRIINNLSIIAGPENDYSHTIPFLRGIYSTIHNSYQQLQNTNVTLRTPTATIQSAFAEFNFFFSVNSFDNLNTIIRDNNYLRSEEARATLQNDLSNLEYQKDVVRKQIDALLASFNQIGGNVQIEASQLEALIIRETSLQEQITNTRNVIDTGVVPTEQTDSEFIALYNSFVTTLEEHISLYNQFYRVHINNQASVNFVGGTSGEISGSISLVLAVIGGIILGGGLATLIAIGVEYTKKRRRNKAN